MKKQLIQILDYLPNFVPPGVFPAIIRRDWLDFFYHAVSDETMPHVRHLYPIVPRKSFEEALRYLQTKFVFLSYDQIHAHRRNGRPLSREVIGKGAHLSFDDGFRECFTIIRPLLLKQGIPATFFLVTSWIDNQAMFYKHKISLCVDALNREPGRVSSLEAFFPDASAEQAEAWVRGLVEADGETLDQVCRALGVDWVAFLEEQKPYMTTAQIQQMHREGFTIGAHTTSHQKFIHLTDQEIEREIVESCRRVQEITGQTIVPFSFPHSAAGVSRPLLREICDRNPFVGLLFDTKGTRTDDLIIINRIWAERPSQATRELQPVKTVLLQAYREALSLDMRHSLRGLIPGK